MKHLKTIEEMAGSTDLPTLSEGVMSDIHMIAQDAKNENDFVKKILQKYGDKLKDNVGTRDWLKDMYHDTVKESVKEGKKKGLWANIHAKRKRGEKPAKPGDEDYPDEEAWKAAQEAEITEGKYNSSRDTDDIFFLWDASVDDDRKGITHGVESGGGKRWSAFTLDPDAKGFDDFEKKVKALMKKNRWEYTFDETHGILDIFESLNEGRASAKSLLKNVVKGQTKDVEGISLSKEMAQSYLDWLETSTYGKKFGDLPFNKLFQASFNWGLDRYTKDLKSEYKDLKKKAKEMKESVNERRSNTDDAITDIKDALKKGRVNVGSMVEVSVDSNNKELPEGEYAIMPFTDMGDYWKAGDLKKFADKIIDDLNKNLKGDVELVKTDTGKSVRSWIVKVNEGVKDAAFNLDKIFPEDSESIMLFQDIEDNGTVEDMIEYINSQGNVDMLNRYGIRNDAQVKKLAQHIMKESVNEGLRKGDYIEQYGEIGLVNKATKAVAYVKFPSTGEKSFQPVVLMGATVKKIGKHKGKDLYLVEKSLKEGKVNAKTIDTLTNEIAKLTKQLKDNFQKYQKANLKGDEQGKIKHMKIAGTLTKEKKLKDAELERAIETFGADMELSPKFEKRNTGMKFIKTFESVVNEVRKAKAKRPNEVITLEVDLAGDGPDIINTIKKFKLAAEPNGNTPSSYDVTGKKKDILNYLQSEYYALDASDIEDMFPVLLEWGGIFEGREYRLGDKWRKDFDYYGMVKMGTQAKVTWPIKKLNQLFDSFTDVNYHTEAQGLGIAIDWIEDGDKKGAKYYMDQFNDACKDTLEEYEEEMSAARESKIEEAKEKIKIPGGFVDVDTIEIEGVDTREGPDDGTSDAFAASAKFVNGRELNDNQLDKLTDDYPDLIHRLAMEQFFESHNSLLEYSALDHEHVFGILDIAGRYTSDASQAANQMWSDIDDLVKYVKYDHIPKKWHKEFDKHVADYKKSHKIKESAEYNWLITEGQFSWITQDSGEQIGSERENTIDVWMFDNKGGKWYERKYQGYGEFGGMDYYILLAKMNGYTEDNMGDAIKKHKIRVFGNKPTDALRQIGIDLAFNKMPTLDKGRKTLFPALVANPRFNWKQHDFTKEAESDPDQSWYVEPEEDYADADGYW